MKSVMSKFLPFLVFIFFSHAATAGFLESITSKGGGAELPKPSANYNAKADYSEPQKKVFNAALVVLGKNSIDVASTDRESGRIATDYVAGPTFSAAFGLLGSNSTRYKFNIMVSSENGKTKVNVNAKLESSGDEVQSWRDVSADNKPVVSQLRDWMYEQIEKQLN